MVQLMAVSWNLVDAVSQNFVISNVVFALQAIFSGVAQW